MAIRLLLAALALLVWAPAAPAHEGHAGPMVTFVETAAAVKAMLPAGGTVVRRKAPVPAAQSGWAKEALGAAPLGGIQTYYLARGADGAPAGAAMVAEVDYGHGEATLAVGVDPHGRITRAAVLSANRKYVADIKAGLGTGYLDRLAGMEVAALAREKPGPGDAGQAMLHLSRMAVTLAALLHGDDQP